MDNTNKFIVGENIGKGCLAQIVQGRIKKMYPNRDYGDAKFYHCADSLRESSLAYIDGRMIRKSDKSLLTITE